MGNIFGIGHKWGVIFNQSKEEIIYTLHHNEVPNIKKNTVIQKLTDPDFVYASLYDTIKLKTYQFTIKTMAAKYFSVGRQSTIKAAFSGGWVQSPNIFRNELFQIGGYRLMRGFDEESIFASQYAVTTAEYRYLVGLNSYFFVFADGVQAHSAIEGSSHDHFPFRHVEADRRGSDGFRTQAYRA